MTTLADRLRIVMKTTGLNPTSWSVKAGLSRDHVRQAIKNDRDDMSVKSLALLASVTPYSLEWLGTGEGPMFRDDRVAPDDPKYPGRAIATVAARVIGYRAHAVAAVGALDHLDHDPGADYWLTLIRLKDLEEADPGKSSLPPKRVR